MNDEIVDLDAKSLEVLTKVINDEKSRPTERMKAIELLRDFRTEQEKAVSDSLGKMDRQQLHDELARCRRLMEA